MNLSMIDFKNMLSLLRKATSAEEVDCYRKEIAKMMPAVVIMFDYDQKNSAHQYDLWMHCIHTVLNLPKDIDDDMLYLSALLHDIGKPYCQVSGTKRGDTEMHYYGHQIRSMEIVRDEILPNLHNNGILLTNEEQKRLLYYVEHHDDRVTLQSEDLRRHLEIASLEEFQKLMLLEVADAKAHVQIPIIIKRVEICEKLSGDYALQLYRTLLQV